MGSLKPGATYIYESPDGGRTVFAREALTNEKILVGYKHDPYYKTWAENYHLETFWKDVLAESQTNEALRLAIENVKILYHLSKNDGKE